MNTRSIAAKGSVAAFVFLGGLVASSVLASAASNGCFVAPARLSDSKIDAFLASPSDLLSANPTGGIPLATAVRELVGSSSDALSPLASLIASATPAQKAAIGAGMARAAKACQVAAPDYAQQIQQQVAAINSPEVLASYLGAINDTQTASIGAAGGGTAATGGGAAAIGGAGAGTGVGATQGGTTTADTPTSTASQTTTFSSGRSVTSVSPAG